MDNEGKKECINAVFPRLIDALMLLYRVISQLVLSMEFHSMPLLMRHNLRHNIKFIESSSCVACVFWELGALGGRYGFVRVAIAPRPHYGVLYYRMETCRRRCGVLCEMKCCISLRVPCSLEAFYWYFWDPLSGSIMMYI